MLAVQFLSIRRACLLALLLMQFACGGGGGGGSDSGLPDSIEGSSRPDSYAQDGSNGDLPQESDGTLRDGVGGGSSVSSPGNGTKPGGEDQTAIPDEEEEEEESAVTDPFEPISDKEAARFLSQATFGPDTASITELEAIGLENWLLSEFEKPASLHLNKVLNAFPAGGEFLDSNGKSLPEVKYLASHSFWETAIKADDQLRQRMAYALSQILVISPENNLARAPQMTAQYMDLLTRGAFGNYRDLLQQVTYSIAMGNNLTYRGNRKADPKTGRLPDENYAREILQLFTIGLVELNQDGTPKLDSNGREIELYDNVDIQELAKVFTGLSFQNAGFYDALETLPLTSTYRPMVFFDQHHSPESKRFLTTNIPANTSGEQSLEMALDGIFSHPNVGPFVSRQLIQRFITSNPTPAYVRRAATAFDNGTFQLASGAIVGTGRRGDLKAVLAAILLDTEARSPESRNRNTFGKLREPVLRFTHWARAFEVNSADATNVPDLHNTANVKKLGQHPFRSPSVFNFYRPGYVAPGSNTGSANLSAPELQITDASSIIGYARFMKVFIFGVHTTADSSPPDSFLADYSQQIALASDPEALIDNLDLLLTHGSLRPDTRQGIAELVALQSADTREDRLLRAQLASFMIMTTPEYIVLR